MENKNQLSMKIFSKPVRRKTFGIRISLFIMFAIALVYSFSLSLNNKINIAESRGNTDEAVNASTEKNSGMQAICADKCGDGHCDQKALQNHSICYENEFNCLEDCGASISPSPAEFAL